MLVQATSIPGLLVVEPVVHRDHRGYFLERYHADRYRDAGIPDTFVQDNHSHSARDVLRGLHYQRERPQGKLVEVIHGTVFDVAVDLRPGSPTFGRWEGTELSAENRHQLWVPPGFAHGFCVLSDSADVLYKCTDSYDPSDERGLLWNDAAVAVRWPIGDPILSEKDNGLPRLSEIAREDLPHVAEVDP